LFSILSIFVHQFDQKGSYNEDTEKSTSFFLVSKVAGGISGTPISFLPSFFRKARQVSAGLLRCAGAVAIS